MKQYINSKLLRLCATLTRNTQFSDKKVFAARSATVHDKTTTTTLQSIRFSWNLRGSCILGPHICTRSCFEIFLIYPSPAIYAKKHTKKVENFCKNGYNLFDKNVYVSNPYASLQHLKVHILKIATVLNLQTIIYWVSSKLLSRLLLPLL